MKFKTNQSTFNEILSTANRAVPTKAVHPVLTCFLIEAESSQGTVNVTGFDLAMGINATFSAIVEKGGICAVPAKLLLDIVSRLPEGEVVCEESDMLLTLQSLSGNYEVRTMEPDEYPTLPDISENPLWQIQFNPEKLTAGIGNTAFAASADEAKQVLCGIHLKIGKNGLEFAATDGHRLSVAAVPPEDPSSEEGADSASENATSEKEEESEFEVTIPLRAAREFERLLYKYEEPVVLNFSEEQVQVSLRTRSGGKQIAIVSRTLNGAYPNYPDLLPPVLARKIVVDRKELLASIERISVFASGRTPTCIFTVSEGDGRIALSSETQDSGSGRESIEAQVAGGDITFGFNIKYLLDILKTAQSKEIELHANSALAPVVFKPAGDGSVTFLMMPVQLRGGNNESTRAS